jgi:hypothetical protein
MTPFSDYSRILLCIAVWREMRSVPDAWAAVTHVILNVARAKAAHDIIPLDEALVLTITRPYELSSMTAPHDPGLVKWPIHDALWDALCSRVESCLEGHTPDITNGAIHYFSLPLLEPPVKWGPVTKTLEIQSVQFFGCV